MRSDLRKRGILGQRARRKSGPPWPASQYHRRAPAQTISEVLMATVGRDLKSVEVTPRELWLEGTTHPVLKELRKGLPVHWTESFEELPHEAGFWSVTTADDVHILRRDWQTYSSEVGGVVVAAAGGPIELARAMFIGMGPPKHDRLKALFPVPGTPQGLAA